MLSGVLAEEPVLDQSAFGIKSVDNRVRVPVSRNREDCDFVLRIECLQTLADERPYEEAAHLAILGIGVADIDPVKLAFIHAFFFFVEVREVVFFFVFAPKTVDECFVQIKDKQPIKPRLLELKRNLVALGNDWEGADLFDDVDGVEDCESDPSVGRYFHAVHPHVVEVVLAD